jgi:hypothetical protein
MKLTDYVIMTLTGTAQSSFHVPAVMFHHNYPKQVIALLMPPAATNLLTVLYMHQITQGAITDKLLFSI